MANDYYNLPWMQQQGGMDNIPEWMYPYLQQTSWYQQPYQQPVQQAQPQGMFTDGGSDYVEPPVTPMTQEQMDWWSGGAGDWEGLDSNTMVGSQLGSLLMGGNPIGMLLGGYLGSQYGTDDTQSQGGMFDGLFDWMDTGITPGNVPVDDKSLGYGYGPTPPTYNGWGNYTGDWGITNPTPSGTDYTGDWGAGDNGSSWGGIDTSEGTHAGDYYEGGFSQEDADFATSFDDDGSSSSGGTTHDSTGNWN